MLLGGVVIVMEYILLLLVMGFVVFSFSMCCFMVYECVMNGVFIRFIFSVFCIFFIMNDIVNFCL